MAKKITLREIAALTGTSVSTVLSDEGLCLHTGGIGRRGEDAAGCWRG